MVKVVSTGFLVERYTLRHQFFILPCLALADFDHADRAVFVLLVISAPYA